MPHRKNQTNQMINWSRVNIRNRGKSLLGRARAGSVGHYLIGFSFIAALCFTFSTGRAQNRDHLTDAESELIRENQQLDKRIEVFIKAIDRRFAIVSGATQAEPKKKDKDKQNWGEPPTGTHAQLLEDIAGILDEAITNIDDVSRRDEKNPLISRSLRTLTAASNRYVTQLAALKNQTKDPDDLSAIEHIAVNANQIIEVGSKLPTPAGDTDKKKKKP
jgi:hypothetical protein